MTIRRRDLSSWVVHFIHDRNPENDPAYELNEGETSTAFPYHEDHEVNARFEHWQLSDEAAGLAPDDSALCVLLKITADGHIRAGWSYRNNRQTIYGPRAAVCCTEMPLCALIEYVKQRKSDAVGAYAIGLLKKEFYAAGGRPVIYGVSSCHRELPAHPKSFGGWPRKLHPSCGIAEPEQYRYVSMNLDSKRPIDWSHEREWRWADHTDQCSCPGLPVWLANEPVKFTEAMIVVPTTTEAERLLNLLKELYDAGIHNFGHEYVKGTLRGTRVVPLDQLPTHLTTDELASLRLEDIPTVSIKVFKRPKVSDEFLEQVESVLVEADQAAIAVVEAFLKSAPRTRDGFVADVCGFAGLVICDPQSPLATALLKLDQTSVIGGIGYKIGHFGRHACHEQALSVAEAAVAAAKAVFEKHFPDLSFSVRTVWD